MSDVVLYLIPVFILGVVGALALGLRAFMSDGAEARARSNRMMQWRVILQFIAVLLIVIFLVALGSGN